MKSIEAVIFDLDGTLIKSQHDYDAMAEAAKSVLLREGVKIEDLSSKQRKTGMGDNYGRFEESRKIWRTIG
jgi:beta-phosphoglucomutase-like phosphatase (HAD superfamily)